MTSFRLAICAGLLTMCLSANAQMSATAPFRISSTQQQVKIGNPVVIELHSTNTLDHSIMVQNDGYAEERYFVEVVDSTGVRQRMTDEYARVSALRGLNGPPKNRMSIDQNGIIHRERLRESNAALMQVKPGGETKDSTELGRLYHLEKPGTYTLHLEKTDPDTGLRMKSNSVTIIITQ